MIVVRSMIVIRPIVMAIVSATVIGVGVLAINPY
jgi:hypothetical protein